MESKSVYGDKNNGTFMISHSEKKWQLALENAEVLLFGSKHQHDYRKKKGTEKRTAH